MSIYDPKKTYIPILKAKSGELSALGVLKDGTADNVIPLLEVPRAQWDFVEGRALESTEHLLGRVVPLIQKNWGSRPFFLDIYDDLLVNGNGDASEELAETESGVEIAATADEENLVEILSTSLAGKDLQFIPVVSFDYSQIYNKGLVAKFSGNNRGFAMRVTYNPDEILDESGYDTFLGDIGLEPKDVDLIIDFGSVYKDGGDAVYLAYRMLLAETPHVNDWRNLVIASSSFPKTVGGLMDKNSDILLPRAEWQGWSKLAGLKKLARLPVYSDYSVAHPEVFDDIDPRHMKLSGSIRYTTNDSWLLMKGERLTGKGSKGYDQFHELAQKIIDTTYYRTGDDASWGDEFIYKCAHSEEKDSSTGNLTTWRKVGNSQHIEYVIQQLAKLFESA